MHWNPIENLPEENGFYLVTYAFKIAPEIRITRAAEFIFSRKEFSPMLVEYCFDAVKRGLADEWQAVAWAEMPLPDLTGLRADQISFVGYNAKEAISNSMKISKTFSAPSGIVRAREVTPE